MTDIGRSGKAKDGALTMRDNHQVAVLHRMIYGRNRGVKESTRTASVFSLGMTDLHRQRETMRAKDMQGAVGNADMANLDLAKH
ncbi:hypothetical protein N7535_000994 [Penicillium sp. DV-2018c]|nr:hypothetical protein N7535_000994 [Penicillium sp. DV-2018c]